MVTVFHYTPVNAKQFDGLNIDGLAGKHQKHQNFPRQNFALYGIKLHLSCNVAIVLKLVALISTCVLTILLPNECYNSCYLYRRAPFSRATNFVYFMDFFDFHKICFTKNYWKSYRDMDCRLKRNIDL